MSADVLEKMLRQILPYRFHIESVDGTWKLNQNKTEAARHGAAVHIETGIGQNLSDLARLMKDA